METLMKILTVFMAVTLFSVSFLVGVNSAEQGNTNETISIVAQNLNEAEEDVAPATSSTSVVKTGNSRSSGSNSTPENDNNSDSTDKGDNEPTPAREPTRCDKIEEQVPYNSCVEEVNAAIEACNNYDHGSEDGYLRCMEKARTEK